MRLLSLLTALSLAGELAAQTSGKEPTFEFHWMPVHGRRMDTVVYDFNGDGRPDVLNTSVDFDRSPPVRWFALHLRGDDGRVPDHPTFIWPVDDRACAVAYGDFVPGAGVEIAFLAADGVYYYPWKEGLLVEIPRKLLHLRTFFTAAPGNSIPIWQFAEDYDGDGRHDLTVPVPDGYRIFFQTEPGRFPAVSNPEGNLPDRGRSVLTGESYAERTEVTAAHLSAIRRLPRPAYADIDGDGRSDLLTIRKDVITYFFQSVPRTFSSLRPHRMEYAVPTLQEEAKKDTVNVSMTSFVDINQDRVADLVVTKIEGTVGLTESVKTRIYLNTGTGRGNFIADKFIKIDGVSIDPGFIDMNQDGKLDVATSRLRTDLLGQGASLLVFGDVTVSYEVFQFDPKSGTFLPEPVWSKDVRVTREDLEKKGVASTALVMIRGDFSGDGRPDMMFIDPRREVLELRKGRVHYSGSTPVIGFEEQAFWERPLERHPKWASIVDTNADGICDIYLMYGGMVGIVESRRK